MKRLLILALTVAVNAAPAASASSARPGAFSQLRAWSGIDDLPAVRVERGEEPRLAEGQQPPQAAPCSAGLELDSRFAKLRDLIDVPRAKVEELVLAACIEAGGCSALTPYGDIAQRTLAEMGMTGMTGAAFRDTVKHYYEGHDHKHAPARASALDYNPVDGQATFAAFVDFVVGS